MKNEIQITTARLDAAAEQIADAANVIQDAALQLRRDVDDLMKRVTVIEENEQ